MSGQVPLAIRAVTLEELPAFFAYLDDHLGDNGSNGTLLFQPMPRAASRFPADKRTAFSAGLATPLDQPGWRRAWIALGEAGDIAGHIDLRARPDRAAAHRALLGMGVHRARRRQGLGLRLIDAALEWATLHTALDWIDLEVLSVNEPARTLYRRAGFATVGELPDMFRLDGDSLDYTLMVRRLRVAPALPDTGSDPGPGRRGLRR